MALSVGFRITVSLLILLPKLRGSDSYPGGTVSHRTRQPSLDAHRLLSGRPAHDSTVSNWPDSSHSTSKRRASTKVGASWRIVERGRAIQVIELQSLVNFSDPYEPGGREFESLRARHKLSSRSII